MISPLLSNIYAHYVYDLWAQLWAQQWRKRNAMGYMIVIRYADEAKRFLMDLKDRLSKFALQLHPKKTRLIQFGRFAARNRARNGLAKPETFEFLGFVHICGLKRDGCRRTVRRRLMSKVKEIGAKLNHNSHTPIPEQGRWLGTVVKGFFAYHAIPGNLHALSAFRNHLTRYWLRALRRRSQRHRMSWGRITALVNKYLPNPRTLHPWPERRFLVTHPR